MAVSKKARALYFKIFDGVETATANAIMTFQARREMKRYVRKMPRLTSEQKKAVRKFWKPYCRIDSDWIRYYTFITGKFDPRYIPDVLQHTRIDQHFNSRKLGYGFNDKNYYSLLFPGIKQPVTVVRKIGGFLFDETYRQIDLTKALELLAARPEVIVKPSQESGGGRDIRFYDTKADANELKKVLLDKSEKNIIVQDIVRQHHKLAKMHPQSLNTVRIYTLMLDDGVHVLSASLKMGANDSRIDNVERESGIIAGIKEGGELMNFAYYDLFSGKTTDRHPQGMLLSEIRVPSYERMIDTVKRAAQYIGNFKLVGWDLSVDENKEVILIEANMRKGGIGPIQCMHGPFYGELTEKVLNEVFGKNKE
ncbi:MAG: sugar-transfer associated ATP-grasp domain-containing protein [Bacteroidales bacterium]|nr:sugar-transfer associated ATP-grasp domain-containing protein [Bacteroidales bacterium]